MKKIFVSVCLLVGVSVFGFCQEDKEFRQPLLNNPISMAALFPRPEIPADIEKPVWFGEKLKFKIKWGAIAVGSATMESDGVVDIGRTPFYYLKTTANSNKFVDTFFKVRDINESVVNVKDLSSLGFSKQIREGEYLWDEWVIFNSKDKKYMGQKKDGEGNISKAEGDIPGKVQDILSALYYVRAQKLEVGRKIIFDVNTRKNWPLVVKVIEREKIKVPAGEFDCFVVEPKMRDKGIFVQKGKSLKIWVTADKYHMPVLMKAEVFIGHVSALLESYSRPYEGKNESVT